MFYSKCFSPYHSKDQRAKQEHLLHCRFNILLNFLAALISTQGDFKIAHCGGFHSFLNLFIKAVNLVAKLLHHNIRWDTETIGCDPRYTGPLPNTCLRDQLLSVCLPGPHHGPDPDIVI